MIGEIFDLISLIRNGNPRLITTECIIYITDEIDRAGK